MIHELLDKLKKLKALEDGARSVGSLAEAENAAEKYQALLLKHNLDEQQVMDHALREKIEMLETRLDPNEYAIANSSKWVEVLLTGVAKSCLCKLVKHAKDGSYSILGEKQNVAGALYMMEQLVSKIYIAKVEAWKKYTGFDKKGRFSRGFLAGAAEAIALKLYAAMETENKNQEMGLMVISKMQKATEFMHQQYPRLSKGRAVGAHSGSSDGFAMGHAAGSNMSANKGISNNQKQIGR